MSQDPIIRNETPADEQAIAVVTKAAFRTLAVSNQTEPFIIAALRSEGALSVSLVAEIEGRVVGHVAFSPVEISDGSADWYALGPISVLPELQRQGIGRALMNEGLSRLRAMGAHGCCLVGHPDYYKQFGFKNSSGLGCDGVPAEVFFALLLKGGMPQGTVQFHKAFAAQA